jgi:hypothetical protein
MQGGFLVAVGEGGHDGADGGGVQQQGGLAECQRLPGDDRGDAKYIGLRTYR